jgi:hypothetical protein
MFSLVHHLAERETLTCPALKRIHDRRVMEDAVKAAELQLKRERVKLQIFDSLGESK